MFPALGVQHREGGKVRLAFTEQKHLSEERVLQDGVLHIDRRHLLAVRHDDDLLQPARNVDVPLLVEPCRVPRVEPAVGQHDLLRRLRVLPIAEHAEKALLPDELPHFRWQVV